MEVDFHHGAGSMRSEAWCKVPEQMGRTMVSIGFLTCQSKQHGEGQWASIIVCLYASLPHSSPSRPPSPDRRDKHQRQQWVSQAHRQSATARACGCRPIRMSCWLVGLASVKPCGELSPWGTA